MLQAIKRNPQAAANQNYDIVIVGGGIHGVMLSLEAGFLGKRSLLVERADFGGGASFNSLRILHGGLRYLQSLDLPRFFESVAERRWYMRSFPDLVEPLPCVMPLFGDGLKRNSVLAVALAINDILSAGRNRGLRRAVRLPSGRLIGRSRLADIGALVGAGSLRGAALWYDTYMPYSERVLIEALRWSCSLGGEALNYVAATALETSDGRAIGIEARDQESGERLRFSADVVINAAGSSCKNIADSFHSPLPKDLTFSLAWNVLFDRELPSPSALAVTARRPGAQTFFLCPFAGRLLAGTGHLPPTGASDGSRLATADLERFIDEINEAAPALNLRSRDVARVFTGYLPAESGAKNSLAVRDTIVDHSRHAGPDGLFTLCGIKFTTARRAAQRALRLAMPGTRRKARNKVWSSRPLTGLVHGDASDRAGAIEAVIEEESVLHLDDLMLRRTALWNRPESALLLAPDVCRLFGWSATRRAAEMQRLEASLEQSAETSVGAV